jgi:alanine dehydrogenase
MRVGVPKETKPGERRVALTPAGTRELAGDGHRVLIQAGAGVGSGITDGEYSSAGAIVLASASDVWEGADLVLKVKEPVESEYCQLRKNLVVFTYLHLAPNRPLTTALIESGTTAIAYETVENDRGQLPLLAPMSEVAGRLAAQNGAYFLQDSFGGPGVLIGGAPGVRPARVLVLGGGVVGTHASRVACGMGARVTILERSLGRIRELEELFADRALVLMSDALTLEHELAEADLTIGAVLVRGAVAPQLVDRRMLGVMKPRSVLVDVAIDQGGCFETSHPTTHQHPTFVVERIVHYCVANMPGAVPATATRALTNATLSYVRALASLGLDRALEDPGFRRGLNVRAGDLICESIADAYFNASNMDQAA